MDTHVLVVGDVILDRYWKAQADRISPEAPVPIANIIETHSCAGGAANVAQNISALGSQVTLIGAVGEDEQGAILQDLLYKQKIQSRLVKHPSIRTTSKIRVVSLNQQLIRLDFDDQAHCCGEEIVATFSSAIQDAAIVILSDYGKGVLADPQAIIQCAVKNNRKVIVDPKGTNFAKYKNAFAVTPNYSEFCAVVGECACEEEIHAKAQELCIEHSFEALLITRSEQGMTLVMHDGEVSHFPVRVREVYDVTGAGDTVIAAFAMSLAVGENIEQAARIANIAAGIVIGKFGAATVSKEELAQGLLDHERPGSKLISRELLVKKIEDAHAKNQKIVFTNGCFDVLHKGHAHLLTEAATLGDLFVVALNSDDSVRRLKGKDRPINTLQDRAEMLSHFSSVDWVVSFDQDTPEEMITALNPDILVKGGDYSPEQVVGAEYVKQRGGEVKIIPFVNGYSTSKIISSIVDKEA